MAYDEIESELNWERLSNAIETTPNGDSHTFDDISLKRPSEHEPNGSPKRQKEMTGSIDTSQFDSSGKKPSEREWEHDTEDSAKRQRVATTSNGPKTQNGTGEFIKQSVFHVQIEMRFFFNLNFIEF